MYDNFIRIYHPNNTGSNIMALKTLGMPFIQAEISNIMALFTHFLSRESSNKTILLLGYTMMGFPCNNYTILLHGYPMVVFPSINRAILLLA